MTENLERLVNQTSGEGPSEEFRDRLRALIAEEASAPAQTILGPAAAHGDDKGDEDLVVELRPQADVEVAPRPSRRVQVALLAAVAAIAVVVGIWVFSSDESDVDTVDDQDEIEAGADATPLTAGNTFLEPGAYRLDTLGTVSEFTLDELTGLLVNNDSVVMLTDITSRERDDRTLTMRRLSTLPDPTDPLADVNSVQGWPATDFLGWLDALGPEIVVGEASDTTLGDRDAIRVNIEVPTIGCRSARTCEADTTDAATWTTPLLTLGSSYDIWMVDQSPHDPLVVVAAIDDEAERPWFVRTDEILSTVEFGEPQASPLRGVGAGQLTLQVFGGVRVNVAEGGAVLSEPFDRFARLVPSDVDGYVEFVTAPLDREGSRIESADALIDVLEEDLAQVTELEPTIADGADVRVFEIATGPFPRIAAVRRVEELAREEAGWKPPQVGRLWLIEDAEFGLLLIASAPLGGPDSTGIDSWAELLVESLRFDSRE